MQKILIDIFLEQRDLGGRPDSGLKSQQWTVVMDKFNEDSGYRPLEKDQLQSQMMYLRKKWTIFHDIVTNCSGWGWDDFNSRPTCSSNVWDVYCKAHTGAAAFKDRPLPFYSDLTQIFLKCTASGIHSSSSLDFAKKVSVTDDEDFTAGNVMDYVERGDFGEESQDRRDALMLADFAASVPCDEAFDADEENIPSRWSSRGHSSEESCWDWRRKCNKTNGQADVATDRGTLI